MENVQVPGAVGLPAGIVPPTKLTLFVVDDTIPPHVFVPTLTIVKGAGKISVRFAPVYGVFCGFCSVIIKVVVPPTEKVEGVNRFATPTS